MPDLPKIEVLVVRDPDDYTEVSVFADGQPLRPAEYVEYSVDPGAGGAMSEWRNENAEVATNLAYSDAFRGAVLDARERYNDSKHLDDDEPSFALSAILLVMEDATAAKQAHDARAGGTSTLWVEAHDGRIVCVTQGEPIEPWSPTYRGEVTGWKFAVGIYPSEDWYMDGKDPSTLDVIDADLDNLETYLTARFPTPKTWTFMGHWEGGEIVIEYHMEGEHEDLRIDNGYWEEGLFAASASGLTYDDAEAKVRAEYAPSVADRPGPVIPVEADGE